MIINGLLWDSLKVKSVSFSMVAVAILAVHEIMSYIE